MHTLNSKPIERIKARYKRLSTEQLIDRLRRPLPDHTQTTLLQQLAFRKYLISTELAERLGKQVVDYLS